MAEDAVNDDSRLDDMQIHGLDPYGRAAILLVESLIHGLVARSVLTVSEAIEITDIAADVRSEIAADQREPAVTTRKSLLLIESIGRSLRLDLPAD